MSSLRDVTRLPLISVIDAGGEADPFSPTRPRLGRLVLRAVVALLLLLLSMALVGPERLAEQLRATHLLWFGLAVMCGAVANFVSAWRWAFLARALGLSAPLGPLVLSYAQGITVNVLLPGATVGGDMLRSIRLARLGNAFGQSAVSVLLDRASGLWVLCVMSLLATVGVAVSASTADGEGARSAMLAITRDGPWHIGLYAIGLLIVLGLPLLPWRTRTGPRPGGERPALVAQLVEIHRSVLSRRSALVRSLPASVLVQLLSAGTLWLAARAASADVGFLALLAVAAPIFIAAALPISLGGFGPREFAAGLTFSLIGARPEAGVAAAILYGLTAVVQGVVAAPLLALAAPRERRRHC